MTTKIIFLYVFFSTLITLSFGQIFTINQLSLKTRFFHLHKRLDSANFIQPYIGYHDMRIPKVYPSLSAYPRDNKLINIFLRINPPA